MTTFLIFVGIIALIIIGKFIYDTYLTSNTERDWNEYKSANPHEATVLDNNQGLNFKTDYSVRTDGLYQFRHEGVSPNGEPFKLTMWLAFNKKNRVFKEDAEGFPEIEDSSIKEVLEQISELTETDKTLAEFFCDKGKITMKFMNSKTHGEEYSGSVIKNGLLLTRKVHYWDHSLERQNTKVSLESMKFEFKPA